MTEHTRWEVEHKPIESRGGSNTMFVIGPFHFCLYDDWRREKRGNTYEEVLEAVDLVSRAPELAAEVERLREVLESAKIVLEDGGDSLPVKYALSLINTTLEGSGE